MSTWTEGMAVTCERCGRPVYGTLEHFRDHKHTKACKAAYSQRRAAQAGFVLWYGSAHVREALSAVEPGSVRRVGHRLHTGTYGTAYWLRAPAAAFFTAWEGVVAERDVVHAHKAACPAVFQAAGDKYNKYVSTYRSWARIAALAYVTSERDAEFRDIVTALHAMGGSSAQVLAFMETYLTEHPVAVPWGD